MTKSSRTIAAIAPPAGFDPSTADATALKAFGIPERPTDPQVLKDWLDVWQGPTKDDGMPGRMCEHKKSSASYSSGPWSGRLDRSGGFNTVTSTFNIPTFYAVCAHNSAHSIWNGIGGYGVAQLIQAGIDTAQSGVQDVYPFIEGLPDDPYEIEVASPNVAVGQNINVTTSYSSGTATYVIKNLSTGAQHTYTETPSSFNSNSVEWIDERPQNMSLTYYVDDHRYYYRKSNPTAWSAMSANGHPAGYWQTDGLYMYSNANSAVLATAALNTTTTDTHNWVACP